MSGRWARPWKSPIVRDLAVIGLLWVVMTVLVAPVGDFPLDDDWTYARSVQILRSEGRLDLVFAAVPLVTQVAWGALFTLPFGFSFAALRLSGWMMGVVGLVATYGLLRMVRPTGWVALVGTVVLAVNPLYLVLACTFMTDSPSVALSIVALGVLARAGTGSVTRLAVGFAVLVLALLVRQTALAIAVGVSVGWLASRRPNVRGVALALALPAAAFAVLLGYEVVIRRTVGLPPLYNQPYDPVMAAGATSAPEAVGVLAARLFVELAYLGLFVLPLSLLAAGMWWPRTSVRARRAVGIGGAVLTAFGVALAGGATILPYGNVVYDLGVGPPLLRDVYLLGLAHLPRAPHWVWSGIALLAWAGLLLLVGLAIAGLLKAARARDPLVIAAGVSAATYAAFLALAGFLDRYLLWLVPPALTLVAAAVPIPLSCSTPTSLSPVPVDHGRLSSPPRPWLAVAGLLLVASALFAVAGAHDYFAWNRSRWAALGYVVADLGVPPTRIDGGFEFNGWYGYDETYRERPGVSWWWVRDDEYEVAFGPVDGYRQVARFPYQRWLPPGEGEILVLRRSVGR